MGHSGRGKMNRQGLAEYGGKILPDGILEMRDPNDDAMHRYQYARVEGKPSRRVLPDAGDYDPPAQWEPLDLGEIAGARGMYHPILDYFEGKVENTPLGARGNDDPLSD